MIKQHQCFVKEAKEAPGCYSLLMRVWTKIANAKRQRLFTILSLREAIRIEKLVASMPYEAVELALVEVEPVKGANGEGAPKDPAEPKPDEEKAATA